jgi:hypothetical protein
MDKSSLGVICWIGFMNQSMRVGCLHAYAQMKICPDRNVVRGRLKD